MIRRILDPNPCTRINVAQIKEDSWFKQDYIPTMPEEEEEEDDKSSDDEAFSIKEVAWVMLTQPLMPVLFSKEKKKKKKKKPLVLGPLILTAACHWN